MRYLLCVPLVTLAASFGGAAQEIASDAQRIDISRSKITVRVAKSGLFSALAHNHEIEAPLASGEVSEFDNPSVKLRVDTRKLRVLDPEASGDTRDKIQATMLGPQVLEADRFPEVRFQSTAVEPRGRDHWLVQGNLDLHGQTHPLAVDVTLRDGLYLGTTLVRQTDFGINPISIAGGSVKVKDEVKIEFSIALLK
jgi:polyisoprenoid-binding protein YceI